MNTLNSLHPGDIAVIEKFTADLPLQSRLVEMGISPGVEIRLVKKSPLKGPVEIKIRGYHVSLRWKDAGQILIQN